MRRVVSVAIAAFTAMAVGSVSGVTLATFTDTAANSGMPVGTKRVFPGVRTHAAYSIRDYSNGGAERDHSSEFLHPADTLTDTTGAWPLAFSATRFVSFRTTQHLAGGLATTGVTFNLRGNTAGGTLCFYVETRLASTGAFLATHGTAAAPLGCVPAGPLATTTVALPEVTSTDIANDLVVRVYARSTVQATAIVDVATVTGSTPYGTFTQPPAVYVDAAGPASVTTPWSLAFADGAAYRNDGQWANTFSGARYIDFDVDSDVPAAAIVTSATLTHAIRDFNGNTICWYVEIWTTTMLARHGSATAPYCATGAAWTTQVLPLPEVNTAAEANALTVRIHARITTAARDSYHGLMTVGLNYHVN